MNKHPMHPITQEHIQTYREDGVVCLRQMFDPAWIAMLRAAAEEVTRTPEAFGLLAPSHGPMVSVSYLFRKSGPFRDFLMNGPLGEIVGRVIEANTIQIFHDHLFYKPPLSPKVMQWHADHGWSFTGSMIPNIWIALSPVNAENGRIEFLGGYHHYCQRTGMRAGPAGHRDFTFPDFELERDNPDFEFKFLTWNLEPGDAVLFHMDIPHFSKGNASTTVPRAGLSVRVLGDDAFWCTREGLIPVPGIDLAKMPDGVHPEPSEEFPVIWRRPADEPRAYDPETAGIKAKARAAALAESIASL